MTAIRESDGYELMPCQPKPTAAASVLHLLLPQCLEVSTLQLHSKTAPAGAQHQAR
jgi:hypothetical protein